MLEHFPSSSSPPHPPAPQLPMWITMTCYTTAISSLKIEGRESRRFRQVNCDVERSVPTQCDRFCSFRYMYFQLSKKNKFTSLCGPRLGKILCCFSLLRRGLPQSRLDCTLREKMRGGWEEGKKAKYARNRGMLPLFPSSHHSPRSRFSPRRSRSLRSRFRFQSCLLIGASAEETERGAA